MTKASRWLGLALIVLGTSGCYLGHVASGQAQLLWARRPIDAVIGDPSTAEELQERLERVLAVRAFADRLGLAVENRYSHYAPWPGDHVVTTVVATRPGEVEAAGFWFPIVGRVPYKGYFDTERADDEANRLRERGLDVCEVPVRAYSTLGWFDDPVTGPMLRQPAGTLVETLLHELVHATAFVSSEPGFNEGVASFIGEEARVRFFAEAEGPTAAERERARVEQQRSIREELLRLRRGVEALYASDPEDPTRAARRETLEQETRDRVATLLRAAGRPGEDADKLRLNDACLALTATYAADTACYAEALDETGGDLRHFVERLRTSVTAEDPRADLLGSDACPPDSPEHPIGAARGS